MSKVAERKAQLHADLIAKATERVARDGVTKLRARDLAQDVGCSLGAIYNVFEDLDALVLHVSRNTLLIIDEIMSQSAKRCADEPATRILVDLAHTYCDFVVENTNLWRTLFEHPIPADMELPDWLVEHQVSLLNHITGPLSQLMPKASEEELLTTSRLLFSAVHGVVNLAVDQRTIGLRLDEVKGQLEFLVGMFVAGVQQVD